MKKLRIAALALLAAGASVLMVASWDPLDPTMAHPPTRLPDKAEVQSGSLQDTGESESHGRRELQPADVRVVVVDEHTGEALSKTQVRVDGSDTRSTAQRVYMSDADGGILLPRGTFRLSPVDGFSFVARSVSIEDETREVRIEGQFRVRLTGDRGCRAEIRALRELTSPDGSTTKQSEAPWYAIKGEPLGDIDGWQVFPSAKGQHVIAVEGATVSPAHKRWVGVETHDLVARTKSFTTPVEDSPPTVSAVFLKVAGASLEFTLKQLLERSNLTYEIDYSEGGRGRVTLLRTEVVAGGNSMTRPVAKREIDRGDDRVVFESLRSGTYLISSAILYGDTIVVSQQSLESDGNTTYLLKEVDGLGPHELFLGPWVADLQFMRVRSGVGIKANAIIPLAGVICVHGLAGPSGDIRMYDERNGGIESYKFDLRKASFLGR